MAAKLPDISEDSKRRLKSSITKLGAGLPMLRHASPDELLGELFEHVQLSKVHPDGKTFVDQVPTARLRSILRQYELQRRDPHFDLNEFVSLYFRSYIYRPDGDTYHTKPGTTPSEHITELWGVLRRETYRPKGSLIPLPYPYVTPGGRFQEQFYWDSYFIMLGLAASGDWKTLEGMVKNNAYMIRKLGFIPTGNRTYFLSRSQPPFFAHMVQLLASKKGKSILPRYLPYLLAEYAFWMKGNRSLGLKHRAARRPHAFRRVVRLPRGGRSGSISLNRYYDNKSTPRPESHREDVEAAEAVRADKAHSARMYLDLRAGAESGWDFSSRWLRDPHDISSIHTTDILPIDLNCLLVTLEQTIAEAYKLLKNPLMQLRYARRADARAEVIRDVFWNDEKGFFFDFDFVESRQTTVMSLAAVFPLYAGIASQEQADRVAAVLDASFLKKGGLLTSLIETGQQWDAPNGWAPLQWVAIEGLRRYGHDAVADKITKAWVGANLVVFKREGKLVEKYNVQGSDGGGGGEYPLQDGFGWTNGVLLRLLSPKSET